MFFLGMRIAIFGDINGEYLWLRRLLKKTGRDGVDMRICHGDITGKRITPNLEQSRYCIDLLIQHGVYCLRGNHEDEILSSHNPKYDDVKDFFRDKPSQVRVDDLEFMVSHRSPLGKFTVNPSLKEFAYLESQDPIRIAIFGHSHMRYIHSLDGTMVPRYSPRKNRPYDVSEGLHLVNTGTTNIGFPISFNLLPGYVLYDAEEKSITFRGLI